MNDDNKEINDREANLDHQTDLSDDPFAKEVSVEGESTDDSWEDDEIVGNDESTDSDLADDDDQEGGDDELNALLNFEPGADGSKKSVAGSGKTKTKKSRPKPWWFLLFGLLILVGAGIAGLGLFGGNSSGPAGKSSGPMAPQMTQGQALPGGAGTERYNRQAEEANVELAIKASEQGQSFVPVPVAEYTGGSSFDIQTTGPDLCADLTAEEIAALQKLLSGMSKEDRAAFLKALAAMSPDARMALAKMLSKMSAEDAAELFKALAQMSPSELAIFAEVISAMSPEGVAALFKTLSNMTPEQLAAFSKALASMSAEDAAALFAVLADMSAEDLTALAKALAGMSAEERSALINALAGMSASERATLAKLLAGMSAKDAAALLKALAEMSPEERAALAQALANMSPAERATLTKLLAEMSSEDAAALLKALSAMSPEERAALAQALANMSPADRAALTKLLADMSSGDAGALLKSLTEMTAEQRAALARALADMTPEERGSLISLLDNMSAEDAAALLKAFSEMSADERAALAQALANMTPEERAALIKLLADMSAEDAAALLKALAEMSPEERAALAKILSEMTRAQRAALVKLLKNMTPEELMALAKLMENMSPEEITALINSLNGLSPEELSALAKALSNMSDANKKLLVDLLRGGKLGEKSFFEALAGKTDEETQTIIKAISSLGPMGIQALTTISELDEGEIASLLAEVTSGIIPERRARIREGIVRQLGFVLLGNNMGSPSVATTTMGGIVQAINLEKATKDRTPVLPSVVTSAAAAADGLDGIDIPDMLKIGTVLYSMVEMTLDSDQEKIVNSVLCSLLDPKLKDWKVMGAFKREGEGLVLKFDKLITPDGQIVQFSGYGINPSTDSVALASYVNSHTFARWSALFVGTSIAGLAEGAKAAGTQVKSIEPDGTEVTTGGIDTTGQILVSTARLGEETAKIAVNYFNTPPTVRLKSGEMLAIAIENISTGG